MGVRISENLYEEYGVPTLDLVFTQPNNGLLNIVDNGQIAVEFTRSSTATYVGSDGLIKTAASNEARFDHDASGNSLGLLIEESRTNTWTYSEQPSQSPWTSTNITVTENNATSPDGNLTGALLSSSSSGDNYVYQTFIENIPTFTIYAKAGTTNNLWVRLQSDVSGRNVSYNFNLSNGTYSAATGNTGDLTGWTERKSITNVGNGWYRIEMGFTSSTVTVTTDYQISASTDGNASASGETVYIWGAQLEKDKTFPTSYIPTAAGISTRGADVAQITGAGFSSFYNQSEGTLFTNITPHDVTNNYYAYSISDGTSSERIVSLIGTSYSHYVVDGGSIQAQINYAGYTANTETKAAAAYATNDVSYATDGTVRGTDTSATIPTVDNIVIMANRSIGNHVTGTIARLTYWPKRLPDSDLQRLTE